MSKPPDSIAALGLCLPALLGDQRYCIIFDNVRAARYLIKMTPAARLVAKAQGTLRAHLNHDHWLLVVRVAVLMSN